MQEIVHWVHQTTGIFVDKVTQYLSYYANVLDNYNMWKVTNLKKEYLWLSHYLMNYETKNFVVNLPPGMEQLCYAFNLIPSENSAKILNRP